MAKRHANNPIGVPDLSEYLKHEDDFAFELDILRRCTQGPFNVEHGGAYRDPVTGKDRQFDIRLRFAKQRSIVRLAVECKNLKMHYPLLVSRVPRRPEESFHDVIFSSRTFSRRVSRAVGSGIAFPEKKLVGKSTAQVGRNKSGDLVSDDAEVYEKWSQAIGSAFDLVSQAGHDWAVVHQNSAATVVFPVLVVPNKTLWTVDYAEDGEQIMAPRLIDHCELYLGKQFTDFHYTASHLLLFTATKFDGYLDKLAVNDKYWELLFPSAVLQQLAG